MLSVILEQNEIGELEDLKILSKLEEDNLTSSCISLSIIINSWGCSLFKFLLIYKCAPTTEPSPIIILFLITERLPINPPFLINPPPLIVVSVDTWQWSPMLTSCSINDLVFSTASLVF